MGTKHKSKRTSIISFGLLIIYLIFLTWRMFFYAYGDYYRIRSKEYHYNLIPFKTIYHIIKSSRYNYTFFIYNIFGNIGVFIPIGFLLYITLNKNRIKYTFVISFCFILLAETMQLALRLGVFDVDDIILNLVGIYFGILICRKVLIYKLGGKNE